MEDSRGVQVDPVSGSLQCGVCGEASGQSLLIPSSTADTFLHQSFNGRRSLLRHQRRHKPENIRKCQFCGKEFTSDYDLRRHLIVHDDRRPFPCDYSDCLRMYKTLNALYKHKRHDHSELPPSSYQDDGDNGTCCLVVDAVPKPIQPLIAGQDLSSEGAQLSTSSCSSSPSASQKQLPDATFEAPTPCGTSTSCEYVSGVCAVFYSLLDVSIEYPSGSRGVSDLHTSAIRITSKQYPTISTDPLHGQNLAERQASDLQIITVAVALKHQLLSLEGQKREGAKNTIQTSYSRLYSWIIGELVQRSEHASVLHIAVLTHMVFYEVNCGLYESDTRNVLHRACDAILTYVLSTIFPA